MVLLPPAGTTWHRHSSLSTAPGQWGLCEAAPSSAPTHHLLGADTVQVITGHSLVPLQDDRDDLCVTGAALHLTSTCPRGSHRLKAHWPHLDCQPTLDPSSQTGQLHGRTPTR